MSWAQKEFTWLKQLADTDRAAEVDRLVREEDYDEWYHLDCKQWNAPGSPRFKDTEGDLAKAASAFANADGGLIIWGYDVRPGRPRTPVPIADLREAVEVLNRVGPLATHPGVPDIRTIAASVGGAPDHGYAVTLVAASDIGPHRAVMGPNSVKDRYYRRNASQSLKLSHVELDEMFGRRPHPHVLPEFVVHRDAEGPGFKITVDLWNVGRGLAKWTRIELRVSPRNDGWRFVAPVPFSLSDRLIGVSGLDSNHGQGDGAYRLYESLAMGEASTIIHSEAHKKYLDINVPAPVLDTLTTTPSTFRWRIMAEGMRTIEGAFPVNRQAFDRCVTAPVLLASWRAHECWGTPLNAIPAPTDVGAEMLRKGCSAP